mmetsp:Transcript_7860/g.10232  ORF Transcript_7860/g.10232 Transcript_7860/m.10232 type:complete len:83 (-) Transcript_7860:166-414(-)
MRTCKESLPPMVGFRPSLAVYEPLQILPPAAQPAQPSEYLVAVARAKDVGLVPWVIEAEAVRDDVPHAAAIRRQADPLTVDK